ncbi:endonuclease/exonuclease/phosphatase family protein [Phytoactinopolyspora endophytica]|uniref:endonuclease/exonuclease/phosphatase family protein n=1 Tax=Phytoactinopolyspora endophytica TaxID=1642495 RepID=UPI00101B9974|nr:endonuclease/exonuclease/phosphatase family protein [Phytoactinopolyspora endophytica]
MLRVVSYNIQDGGEDRLQAISEILRELRPDVAAILEANDRANVELLATKVNMDLVFGEANNEFHMAWLTRHTPLEHVNHRSHELEKTLLELVIEWHGRPLRLYAAHLAPGLEGHHDARRLAETGAILRLLREHTRDPHVLVGDFNAVDSSEVIELVREAGYIDCYRTMHGDIVSDARPVGDPARRIDYAFATGAMASRLRACGIRSGADAADASDHYAVWADFAEDDDEPEEKR